MRGPEGKIAVVGQATAVALSPAQDVGCEGGLECFSVVKCHEDDIEYMIPKTTRPPMPRGICRPTARRITGQAICGDQWWLRGFACRTGVVYARKGDEKGTVFTRSSSSARRLGFLLLFRTTRRNRVWDTVAGVADGPPVQCFLSQQKRKRGRRRTRQRDRE